MLLRTLYVGLGSSGWKLYVEGVSAENLAKIIVDSRVPVEIAKNSLVLIDFSNTASKIQELYMRGVDIYVVDPSRGERIESLPSNLVLVLDYKGGLTGVLEEKGVAVRRVKARGHTLLAYEAILLVHLYSKERRKKRMRGYVKPSDPKLYVKLFKRIPAAATILDNYLVLEPNTLTYTLSQLLKKRRLYVEPGRTVLEVDHRGHVVREEIEFRAYSYPELELIGLGRIIIGREEVKIVLPWGEEYQYILDRQCPKICMTDGTCTSLGA